MYLDRAKEQPLPHPGPADPWRFPFWRRRKGSVTEVGPVVPQGRSDGQ